MHLDDIPHWKFLEFKWHQIENGGLSAQCLVVDEDPLTETLSLVSCLRDRESWTEAIAFKGYCIEKIDTMPFFFFFTYIFNTKSFLKEIIFATDYQLCSHSKRAKIKFSSRKNLENLLYFS